MNIFYKILKKNLKESFINYLSKPILEARIICTKKGISYEYHKKNMGF